MMARAATILFATYMGIAGSLWWAAASAQDNTPGACPPCSPCPDAPPKPVPESVKKARAAIDAAKAED